MLPIVLDPSVLRIGVAGTGEGLRRRLSLLAAAGIEPSAIFDTTLPASADIASLNVLFVAGLGDEEARKLAAIARAAHVLVNVEDVPPLCDFHVPAQVRRGDLLFTVSTGGRSPGLSRALREDLERRFGPEWDARLAEIAEKREAWRAEGLAPGEVSERTRALIAGKDWL